MDTLKLLNTSQYQQNTKRHFCVYFLFFSLPQSRDSYNSGSIDIDNSRVRRNGHAFVTENGMEAWRRFGQREKWFFATTFA